MSGEWYQRIEKLEKKMAEFDQQLADYDVIIGRVQREVVELKKQLAGVSQPVTDNRQGQLPFK